MVNRLPSARVMIQGILESSPASGSLLSREPASPSASAAPPACALTLALSARMFPRPSGASLLHAACSQPSAVNPVPQPLAPFEKEVLLCRLVTQGPSQLPWGILSAFLLWKATTTIANTKERFKGPCEAVTSILLRWGGGGGGRGRGQGVNLILPLQRSVMKGSEGTGTERPPRANAH